MEIRVRDWEMGQKARILGHRLLPAGVGPDLGGDELGDWALKGGTAFL